jgi:hypothetical protein
MRGRQISQKSRRGLRFHNIALLVVSLTVLVMLMPYRLMMVTVEHPSSAETSHSVIRQQPTHGTTDVRERTKMSGTAPNANHTKIPEWMKYYLQWHAQRRAEFLTPTKWKIQEQRPKLLILQCMPSNIKCGGLADRLKPLPLLMLGAFQTKRLLLIRWKDRPAKLEEFLVPPSHSNHNMRLDWTVPDWLDAELGIDYDGYSRRHIVNVKPFLKILHQSLDKDIVTATMQWWDGGEQAYKDALHLDKKDEEFRRSYRDLFRACFEAVEPIQRRLNEIYRTTTLGDRNGYPVDYAVAHYRALWWEDQEPPTWQQQVETAQNAVNCASRLVPKHLTFTVQNEQASNVGRPIYFATDSIDAQKIIQDYARDKSRPIEVIPHDELVHLDRVQIAGSEELESRTQHARPKNSSTVDVSVKLIDSLADVYPVFVDLLLMANGNCMAYGDGGFGKFGLMLSRSYDCSFQHIRRHQIQNCNYQDF